MIKRTAIILLMLLSIIASCGKKAPPRAPNLITPNPPNGLHYEYLKENHSIKLTFSIPATNTSGSALDDFNGVEIFRAAVKDESAFCPNCNDGYVRIFKGLPDVIDGSASFTDSGVTPEMLYYYKVRVYNKKSAGGFCTPLKVSEF